MRSHSTVDSHWRGIPTSYRSWHHTEKTDWHFEWSSGWRYVSIGIDMFGEEDDFGVHFAVPLLWLSLNAYFKWEWARKLRKRFHDRFGHGERSFGFRYSDSSFAWEFFDNDDHHRKDPWWKHGYIMMPWHRTHVFTEILSVDLQRVVFREESGKGRRSSDSWERRQAVEKANSETVPYTYVRKSGERQDRLATYHVDRMGHGFRWLRYPFFVRTSVWVNLDGEIGEGTGSWKGGTTGFGTTLLPGEKPIDAIRRMEATRKFDR